MPKKKNSLSFAQLAKLVEQAKKQGDHVSYERYRKQNQRKEKSWFKSWEIGRQKAIAISKARKERREFEERVIRSSVAPWTKKIVSLKQSEKIAKNILGLRRGQRKLSRQELALAIAYKHQSLPERIRGKMRGGVPAAPKGLAEKYLEDSKKQALADKRFRLLLFRNYRVADLQKFLEEDQKKYGTGFGPKFKKRLRDRLWKARSRSQKPVKPSEKPPKGKKVKDEEKKWVVEIGGREITTHIPLGTPRRKTDPLKRERAQDKFRICEKCAGQGCDNCDGVGFFGTPE